MAEGTEIDAFVLDCSVAANFSLDDEVTDYGVAALQLLRSAPGWVPPIFWLEFLNALASAVKRQRLQASDVNAIVKDVEKLGLHLHDAMDHQRVLEIAIECNGSVYDASYIHLAESLGLKLCTLDRGMQQCAERHGIELWQPPPA